MRLKRVFLLCLCVVLWASAPVQASVADLSHVIDGFMAKQFPEARSHFGVVNGTEAQAENEMVVDLNTVVLPRTSHTPTESRFLLLIVEGKVAASQQIPLDANTDCRPEQT